MDEQLMSPDLLSDLPLGIKHIILSFVPIRDAIQTSLLSRQWRFTWSSLPHLAFDDECVAFDDECVNPPIKYITSNAFDGEWVRHEKRLINFISQTLFLHEGPIHAFELRLSHISMGKRHSIDQWMLFLSRNYIRILVLQFADISFGVEVHSSLYYCQHLTHLELSLDISPPPPSFKGFLFLRSLDIRTRKVDSSTIESIVAHSPLLENLILDGKRYPEITVCAPNLKYFHFKSESAHLSLCTPLLEELIVDFSPTKHLSIGVEFFRHLRTIKLSCVPFDVEKVRTAVFRLITGSPHLQKLQISRSCYWESEASELAFASLWDTESEHDFTFDSLKIIKIKIYGGGVNLMKLIEFLLARSPVLEKLMYKPLWATADMEKVTAQLLRYRRASANAEIVIVAPPLKIIH